MKHARRPTTTRPRLAALLLMLLLAAGGADVPSPNAPPPGDYFAPVPDAFYEDLAFDMPRVEVPTFPDYTVRVTDYGAVGDGETLNTEAFDEALRHVSEQGGGHVVVPRGVWRTGPIALRSNVDLHVEQGALVVFSDSLDLYPLVETSFEGLDTYRAQSPIHGKGLENVAITGEGVFDGSGGAWRPVRRSQLTEDQWEAKVASGGVVADVEGYGGEVWYPTEESMRGDTGNPFNVPMDLETRAEFEEIKDFLRPVMVSIRESRRVLLDGPTFQNSPAWMLHPLMSEHVVIRNLTIRNPVHAWNGDGLDLESSRNAAVYGNSFDVGDDAVCIKSGKDEDGRRRGMPTENVLIRGNTVFHAHGGFVVGSEMSGGVRNVDVREETYIGTDVGVRFKSTRGRGGVVEDVYIADLHMVDIVTEPIRFNLYYGGESPSPGQKEGVVDAKKLAEQIPPVTEETPRFRNIRIRNLTCRGARTALWIQGLPEMSVQDVRLEDVHVTARRGALVTEVDGLELRAVTVVTREGPAFYLHNAHNTHLQDVGLHYRGTGQAEAAVRVEGPFTENVRLEGLRLDRIETVFSRGPNVPEEAVTVAGRPSR